MLHARHHLLADIAALGEIDAAELIHVGLVRKRVAIDEVDAAARHAERDAMGLVVGRFDQFGAEIGGRLAGQVEGQDHADAKRGKPRVGIAEAVFGARHAVPHRQDAECVRQVLDGHLGAQLVEVELVDQAVTSARGQSRKKPPPSAAGASATMQSTTILPCGVSNAANAG